MNAISFPQRDRGGYSPRMRHVATALLIALALSACGGSPVDADAVKAAKEAASARKVLSNVSQLCDAGELADEDQTLTLYGSSRLAFTNVTCVLEALDVPGRVMSHIEQTRALDGRQEDDWNGINAAWTYHPDDGINITLTLDPPK